MFWQYPLARVAAGIYLFILVTEFLRLPRAGLLILCRSFPPSHIVIYGAYNKYTLTNVYFVQGIIVSKGLVITNPFLKCFFIDVRERGKEQERIFIHSLLYMLWPEIKPTTLACEADTLTKWATRPGPIPLFLISQTSSQIKKKFPLMVWRVSQV